MSESKHTPGPWRYVKRPERFRIEDRPSQPAIADVYRLRDGGEANARLIAAAPELLQACRKIEAALESYGTCISDLFGSDKRFLDAMESIRAAIDKATRDVSRPHETG